MNNQEIKDLKESIVDLTRASLPALGYPAPPKKELAVVFHSVELSTNEQSVVVCPNLRGTVTWDNDEIEPQPWDFEYSPTTKRFLIWNRRK